MNTKWWAASAAALGTIACAGVASAQQQSRDESPQSVRDRSRELPAVKDAVELTVGTGYAQGFGSVASGLPKLTDVGTAGGALQLGVGYRILPQLTLGAYGTGAMFGRGDQVDSSANAYSATAGVQVDWHFRPAANVWDPWVSLGTGWRGYWIHTDQGTTSMHGMELAKLQVGVDYRIAPTISISPVIGADLSAFFTRSTPQSNGYGNLTDPNVNTFVFGGLMGRFDIPTRTRELSLASR
jgi:hypothetical protein